MSHIAAYANALSQRGHSCTIAVATKPSKIAPRIGTPLFSIRSYQEILEDKVLTFPNSGPADIIHGWTPRENVRIFVESYRKKHKGSTLIIHLEDNEDSILESHYQRPIEQLRFPLPSQDEPEWSQLLCHPLRYRRFLWEANGVTTLTPSLAKLLPCPKSTFSLSPILDPKDFAPTCNASETKHKYGIPNDKKLIVYPGGVTSNNREDIRTLYLATKLINESGTPCIVAKTGPNCQDLENSLEFPISEIRIDLGYVDANDLNNLIHASDLLVQPGKDSKFNRDRLPCKIPEFLLSGKPTIIPKIYQHIVNDEKECSLFIDAGSPQSIAAACLELLSDDKRSKALGANARTFALAKYSPQQNAIKLEQFYQETRALREESPNSPLDFDAAFRNRYVKAQQSFKKAEQEIASLNVDIKTFQTERERLLAATEVLLQEKQALTEKVGRIKRSGSWYITTPLRFIRRHLFDPFKTTQLTQLKGPEQETPQTQPHPPRPDSPSANHQCHHKSYYTFTKHHQSKVDAYILDFAKREGKLTHRPKISILLPVYDVEEIWLRKCIDSVIKQIYTNWELCIADDASPGSHIRPIIEKYQKDHSNIKVCFRKTNGHISEASNSAFELSTGEYLALLDHDDEIPPQALAQVVDAINRNPTAKIIYSDEDKIDELGIRHDPHFKSDWNYDLFMGCNMISHLGVYDRSEFVKAKGFRVGLEGAQDWDLALRISENINPKDIIHIPEVLYHWRSIPGSTSINIGQKEYAYIAQKRVLEAHLKRTDINAKLQSIGGVNWRVIYNIPNPHPKVCIIIPTKNQLNVLRPCIESLLTKTCYPNFEIQIINNGSTDKDTLFFLKEIKEDPRIKVFSDNGTFNYSRLNNEAILRTQAELICLLNNDIEVIDGSWLTEMIRHALRPEIGVVGAKLLFPHDHVQHCGVIMGIYDIAGHAFKYLHKDDDGHKGRAKLVSAYSAVTGACMLFRKKHWSLVGGLDEDNLSISYSDVDFCLRLNEIGLRSIVTPFAVLYHKESASRGPIQSDEEVLQFEAECVFMRERWSKIIKNDPYYNRNFTKKSENFFYNFEGANI